MLGCPWLVKLVKRQSETCSCKTLPDAIREPYLLSWTMDCRWVCSRLIRAELYGNGTETKVGRGNWEDSPEMWRDSNRMKPEMIKGGTCVRLCETWSAQWEKERDESGDPSINGVLRSCDMERYDKNDVEFWKLKKYEASLLYLWKYNEVSQVPAIRICCWWSVK